MRTFLCLALSLVATATPALADDNKAPKPDADKKVCRRQDVTGSMLGGPRICHTKTEWAAIDEQNEKQTEDALRHARASRNYQN